MSVYPFIEAEKVEHRNVNKPCELLEVSRSAFYEWHKHLPTRRQLDDRTLGERIAEIHEGHPRGTRVAPGVRPAAPRGHTSMH